MKDIEYNRLVTLLKSSDDPVVIACWHQIQEASPGYAFVGSMRANEALDIYSKRKKWNESLSNPKRNQISGYDHLMTNLPKGSDQNVKIHTFQWHDRTATIFCDEQTTMVFGVLIIPKRSAQRGQ